MIQHYETVGGFYSRSIISSSSWFDFFGRELIEAIELVPIVADDAGGWIGAVEAGFEAGFNEKKAVMVDLPWAGTTGADFLVEEDDKDFGFEAEVEEDVLVVSFNFVVSDDLW